VPALLTKDLKVWRCSAAPCTSTCIRRRRCGGASVPARLHQFPRSRVVFCVVGVASSGRLMCACAARNDASVCPCAWRTVLSTAGGLRCLPAVAQVVAGEKTTARVATDAALLQETFPTTCALPLVHFAGSRSAAHRYVCAVASCVAAVHSNRGSTLKLAGVGVWLATVAVVLLVLQPRRC
jgi:hypothetical protein